MRVEEIGLAAVVLGPDHSVQDSASGLECLKVATLVGFVMFWRWRLLHSTQAATPGLEARPVDDLPGHLQARSFEWPSVVDQCLLGPFDPSHSHNPLSISFLVVRNRSSYEQPNRPHLHPRILRNHTL